MQPYDWEILLIAVLVSVACALPGIFLVLRKVSLMSDAISHAILLGIVIAFLYVENLQSPLLILGATFTGLLTVFLVEMIYRTRLVKEDAAIALVFPSLFSVGVLLISLYAGNVHLDIDAVLLGELAFAPFNRWQFSGIDMGPVALVQMAVLVFVNLSAVLLFRKELEISSFDAGLASVLGFAPAVLHYGLMTMVSVTAVSAFDAVGSVLVVALMIVPACAAYLVSDRLGTILWLAPLFASGASIIGYAGARFWDVSLAGAMASAQGLVFLLIYLLAPGRGLLAQLRRRTRLRLDFASTMLTIHIVHHEGTAEEPEVCRLLHLDEHLGWNLEYATTIVRYAEAQKMVNSNRGQLYLTSNGRDHAQKALTELVYMDESA